METELRAFVDRAPKDMELRLLLGDLYADGSKSDEAAKVYREIIRIDESGPP